MKRQNIARVQSMRVEFIQQNNTQTIRNTATLIFLGSSQNVRAFVQNYARVVNRFPTIYDYL